MHMMSAWQGVLLSFRVVLIWFCAARTQAIEFVQMQRDDELWELLITFALGSADLTGMLTAVGSPKFLVNS